LTGSSENSSRPPRLIPDNDTLHADFNELAAGDVFIGRLRLRPSEENLVVDLLERGVRLFPAAPAQLSCRSKVFQAKIFSEYMAPNTRAIHDLHELMTAVNDYHRLNLQEVVTKKDRANAGIGVNLWPSVEDVFNHASIAILPFPFVLQPFYRDCRDIRVIIIDDYLEAYRRDNPDNFRNNLHYGGTVEPAALTGEQIALCRKVMARGGYPYAHLDLMVAASGTTYLTEINLRGGIRGAALTPAEYRRRIDAVHQRYLREQGL
jgi:ribosomal protein S6--L-glutamate ligase